MITALIVIAGIIAFLATRKRDVEIGMKVLIICVFVAAAVFVTEIQVLIWFIQQEVI